MTGRGLQTQTGVALAIVVWFIAGMSLLVAGIVLSARSDTRLAQLHLGRAQAAAVGDGAIALLLADVMEGRFDEDAGALPQGRYQLGEHVVTVLAINQEVLVDINNATPRLMQDAFVAAGMGGDRATVLGNAVVQWRRDAVRAGARSFTTIEDLIAVPDLDRTALDAVRDFVAVPEAGRGLFQSGGRARRNLEMLRMAAPAVRGDALVNAGGVAGRGRNLRVDAIVTIGDRPWLRRRWVSLGKGSNGLPWRVTRTEPVRIVPSRAG